MYYNFLYQFVELFFRVIFYFKSSKKSNNGTDVNAGQIPQLLYRVITGERETPRAIMNSRDPPVHRLSRDFSRSVTSECFNACCTLLQWSWNTFKAALLDVGSSTYNLHAALLDLERLVFISRASLRLLTAYTNEIYPNQGIVYTIFNMIENKLKFNKLICLL